LFFSSQSSQAAKTFRISTAEVAEEAEVFWVVTLARGAVLALRSLRSAAIISPGRRCFGYGLPGAGSGVFLFATTPRCGGGCGLHNCAPSPKAGRGFRRCRSTQGGAGLRSNLSFDYRPIEVRRCPRTLFKPAALDVASYVSTGYSFAKPLRPCTAVSRTFGLQSVVTWFSRRAFLQGPADIN